VAIQMYFVVLKGEFSQDSSRDVQRHVRALGGLILMVTRNGPIVAIDDAKTTRLAAHSRVAMVGPVTLNQRGWAADRLQRVFAENLSKQLQITVVRDAGSTGMPGANRDNTGGSHIATLNNREAP